MLVLSKGFGQSAHRTKGGRGDGNMKKDFDESVKRKKIVVAKVSAKDENASSKKEVLDSRGEVFYEAVPAVATAPKELELPRINTKTADFLESLVIFFAGTAEVLLILRTLLMATGIDGGNILTYLLYASSYPFAMILGSGQGQIPAMNNNVLFENIVFIIIYFVLSYGLIKIIRALRGDYSSADN